MDEMEMPSSLMVRNGTYYVHVRVPTSIVASVGKRFITKSLRTKDPKAARRKLHDEISEINRVFDRHRVQTSRQKKPTIRPVLSFAEIARQHARAISDKEFADRAGLFEATYAEPSRLWAGDLIPLPDSRFFDHLVAEGDLDKIVGYIVRTRAKDRIATLRRMLATGNLSELTATADERSPGIDPDRRLVLARLLARAEIDALEAIISGEPDAGIETAPVVAGAAVERSGSRSGAPSPAEPNNGSGPRLSLVLADWIAEKERTNAWVEKTRHEREAAVKAFTEVCGDHPVGTYAKADAKRFKDVLFKIPPNAHKKAAYKGLGLVAIGEKAEAEGAPMPTAKNVTLKMDAVSSLFIWAKKNFDEVQANPFQGIKPQIGTTPREERDPFSLDELKLIFAAPPFTGAKSERHWLQPGSEVLDSSGKYWIPLIAAYSGARLMEIVQLRRKDIQTIGDVTFFDIRSDDENRVKTRAANRRIPVHPVLVKAGLLAFTARVKKPNERLFPDIEIGSAKNRSGPASKLFIRLIRAAGVKTRKNCFHSFRHSFEDACRDAEIDTAIMNALQGHVERGMAGRYGSGFKLERLDAAVAKIRYGLVFEIDVERS
ncbi:site-specific integrase [Mesorhizobium sp. YIM 152430]|uniref:site-specific integrase n=1 Tax=Mesorhizobium sp. YIM 152430 TaxID=3031761 RepID=UPI0023D9ACAC|nr:site-specific integrase [Mesorhizobium sp. YIM 152430]MDF1600184.1 site-specific integrase [Mesorhizobium sp. YIM 152430]